MPNMMEIAAKTLGRTLTEYAQTTNLFESKPIGYLEIYERYFSSLRDERVKLLELGVATGQSIEMWNSYFVNGTIAGLDLFPKYNPDQPQSQVRNLPRCTERHGLADLNRTRDCTGGF